MRTPNYAYGCRKKNEYKHAFLTCASFIEFPLNLIPVKVYTDIGVPFYSENRAISCP